MRILQLCKKFPFPLKDGEAIAVTYLAKAFAKLGSEVTLLSMNTSKHWFDIDTLPDDFNHYTAIHTGFIDNRIRPFPAFLNLFGSKSYHIERFEDQSFADKLIALLADSEYDVVQLESIYLTPYIDTIRAHSNALIVMRAHNVEYEIWEQVAANSNPLKRWYLERITPRLKQYETSNLNKYDMLVGISEGDTQKFKRLGLKKPFTVSPIGLDVRDYRPDDSSFKKPLSLSFIGSLDWMPNQDGLKWFLNEVWAPVLAPAFPELTFHIAGRTAPRWLQQLNMERVTFHGEVPSAPDFLNQHSVMVVPLLSGSGMRAKILEAMALGKVVLSTGIGMEGVDAYNQKECLIANNAAAFKKAIDWCYQEGPALRGIGQKARNFCTDHFDNLTVAKRLLDEYRAVKAQQAIIV